MNMFKIYALLMFFLECYLVGTNEDNIALFVLFVNIGITTIRYKKTNCL